MCRPVLHIILVVFIKIFSKFNPSFILPTPSFLFDGIRSKDSIAVAVSNFHFQTRLKFGVRILNQNSFCSQFSQSGPPSLLCKMFLCNLRPSYYFLVKVFKIFVCVFIFTGNSTQRRVKNCGSVEKTSY